MFCNTISLTYGGDMFEVKILTEGLDVNEERVIQAAGKHMQYVFNHERFKEWVLGFSYVYKSTTGRLWWKKTYEEKRNCFANNQGLSNFQVYNKLMSGVEYLDPELDSQADIFVKIDRRNRRGVIGYTYQNTKWQYIYHWVLDSWGIKDVAGNIAHEYAHKCSFDHAYYYTAERPFSVPYSIGSFVSNFKY